MEAMLLNIDFGRQRISSSTPLSLDEARGSVAGRMCSWCCFVTWLCFLVGTSKWMSCSSWQMRSQCIESGAVIIKGLLECATESAGSWRRKQAAL
eukprot:6490920-Amphidinium_carterae.9